MLSVESEEHFKAILDADRAIVFVNVDWSSQAALSAAVVQEWERSWSVTTHVPVVAVHAGNPDLQPWFAAWLEVVSLQAGQDLSGGGYGPVLWLHRGKLITYEPFAAAAGISLLAATSDRVFAATGQQ